ncbi:O-acetyl-ADP-ribose deacetylase [Virgibacillus sp. MSP4-1]|uniref:O-acetyl-ADP-ribose deacetylase n=1 Tax=Virgibacillus sp. MSP4-1 TaxID=2700081 RepID=UPI0003A12966|nr:O-acetyl-ADP-ribose deacetylase [Virgibacillus sp. MSP4-1]QHS23718.1 O-acetyl-ADP-ribose deacetylase [Virgibacillus sp. MSP4-1]
MRTEINGNQVELMTGDITRQQTDAIVNAANGSLLGGGGVDGAIHRAAGPDLLEECKQLRKDFLNNEYLPTGEAVLTKGYQLPAGYVMHTVGPVWSNSGNEPGLLANCYQNSLKLAKDKNLSSISFPSISTGVYGYPIEKAASVALETIIEFLQDHHFGKVIMTLFSEQDYQVYSRALKRVISD